MKFLREQNVNTAALKPICSSNRKDARKIFVAMNGTLSLDEINPWHFRALIAPLLAARLENKKVKLSEVVAHIRAIQKRFDILLVEGAGGLLSPLGENFNSRDLILALRANPIVVAQNKIGAINQILLTLEALPKNFRAKVKIVLVSPSQPDSATQSNAKMLAQFVPEKIIFTLPHFGEKLEKAEILKTVRIGRTLSALVSGF
jgi:dethiobiotin synthetase